MAINFPSNPSVNDTFTVDDKTFLWTGEYWRTLSSAVTFPGVIKDADNDTRVEVEQSADEDTIRFNVAGSEKGYFDSSGLTVSDSATANFFVSSGSGANIIPSGTTAERPASPTAGMIRFNETTGEPEWYSSAAGWVKFRNSPSITVSYLIIAGGGAGGGGGGGGGGRLSGSTTATPLDAYTVTVGAGGASGGATSTRPNQGGNGYDSEFASLTSTGGGGGGKFGVSSTGSVNGATGGSGGGTGQDTTSAGAAGTVGQGNAGGKSNATSFGAAGGGGGAGGVGGDAVSVGANVSRGGAGGVGDTTTIITTAIATSTSVGEVSGTDVYFAGGGGGGANTNSSAAGASAGGLGGGGEGASAASGGGSAGTSNTGGGGGGSEAEGGGGANGGSGVVILRYPSDSGISVSAGLTSTTTTVGSDKVTVFTAGTGTVSWA